MDGGVVYKSISDNGRVYAVAYNQVDNNQPYLNIFSLSSQRRLDFWCDFVKEQKIKAFVEHTTCPNLRLGAEQLLRLSGLGGMKANTLVLNIDQDVSDVNDIINDALCLERNVVLLRSIESLNRQVLQVEPFRNIFILTPLLKFYNLTQTKCCNIAPFFTRFLLSYR